MRARRIAWVIAAIGLLLGLGFLAINECSYYAGMGASMKACTCTGREILVYDRTASDGPRKTICVGIVRTFECFQGPGGASIPCPER